MEAAGREIRMRDPFLTDNKEYLRTFYKLGRHSDQDPQHDRKNGLG